MCISKILSRSADFVSSSTGKKRKLDDEELDSGDDEGRNDRLNDDMDGYGLEEEVQESVTLVDVSIGRHALPRGIDSDVREVVITAVLALQANPS